MKEEIKEILTTFLNQVEDNDRTTNHYPSFFSGLQLRVGFGIGKTAKIPWIAFLGHNQTPTDWIFPVFYYFKEYRRIILAYGISEENIPKLKWPITTITKTIYAYFKERGIKPHKYGLSYVFKTYDVNKELDWAKIEEDLSTLLNKYKAILDN
jgi:5-methylcytosine-specific restriction protein B